MSNIFFMSGFGTRGVGFFFFLNVSISRILQFNVNVWAADVSQQTRSDDSVGNVAFCARGCSISELRRNMWEFQNSF